MLKRWAAIAAAAALGACATMAPAGRGAGQSPEAAPAPSSSQPAPEPSAPPPAVAAPEVSAPAPAPRQSTRGSDGDIVVPGAVERQVPPPQGDPRSTAERVEDIRAWDRCVMQVQAAFDRDPMRPQLNTPEQYCRESLGMANRTAVPESRRER